MKIQHFIILLAACTMLSCKTKEDLSMEKLLNTYSRHSDQNKSVVIIIPIDGCGTCIQSTINFFEEKSNISNLLVVASTLQKKKLKMYLSDRSLERPNFIADINCTSERFGLVGTAPNIFFMEKGRVKRKVTVTQENSSIVFEDVLKWY